MLPRDERLNGVRIHVVIRVTLTARRGVVEEKSNCESLFEDGSESCELSPVIAT